MISAKGRMAPDDNRLEDLRNISYNIINDDEYRDGNPFYIKTNSGVIITEDGIRIKTTARMEKYAKTVVREEAQRELQNFLQTLKDDGIVR